MSKKVTVPEIMASKGQRRLSEITAYDYPTALWADKSGVDMLLVGDSLAMVVLGQEDTLSVGMTEMLHHTLAVSRGAKRALVIGDMPFMSYQASVEQALINAGRFMKEARASAVKLEGEQGSSRRSGLWWRPGFLFRGIWALLLRALRNLEVSRCREKPPTQPGF